MKRILLAAGAVAAVVVLGVGAASVVGDPGETAPEPSPSATTAADESKRFDREELDQQVKDQAEQTQAAQDELARKVDERADELQKNRP